MEETQHLFHLSLVLIICNANKVVKTSRIKSAIQVIKNLFSCLY